MRVLWIIVKRTKKSQDRVNTRVLIRKCINKFNRVETDVNGRTKEIEVDCDGDEFRDGVCRKCDWLQTETIPRQQNMDEQQKKEFLAELCQEGVRCESYEARRIRKSSRHSVSSSVAEKLIARS